MPVRLKKYDINIFGFCMMFNIWEEDGKLCYESPDEVMTTLNFAQSFLSNKMIDSISWGFVVPLVGAQLYDICQRHHLLDKDKKITSRWGKVPVKLPGIEEKTMQRLKRKGMLMQMRYGFINFYRYSNWRNWYYLFHKIKYIFKK